MPDTYFSFVVGFTSMWVILMIGFIYLWIRLNKVESKLSEKK